MSCARELCYKREGLKYCQGCGVVMYCSRECQRLEWSFHKELCTKLLPLRLKRYADLWVKHRNDLFNTLWLSYNSLLEVDDHYHRSCLFWNAGEHGCVVCAGVVVHDGPYFKEIATIFRYKSIEICAYRCHQCIHSGRSICETTFFEKGLPCILSQCDKLLPFIHGCKEILVKDILLLIQDLFIYITVKCDCLWR
jgi:hypothetical protein